MSVSNLYQLLCIRGLSWGLFLPMECVWKWCVSSLRMSFREVAVSASWLELVSGWLCQFVPIHKWNISCHISKQGSHSHQQLHSSKVSQWALRKLRKERIPAIWQPSDCNHCLWWALRKLRMWEHRILAPENWGAYQRNDFSDPRVLHFPTHKKKKALNSLTWDFWFSLIENHLLMFQLPIVYCKMFL